MFFESLAHAMGAPQGGAGSPSEMLVQFVPLILMIAVFWFLLIRPQKKRQQEHKNMLANLRRGEVVVTSGGIIGRIMDVDGDVLVLDLGDTRVRVGRGYITGIFDAKAMQASRDGKDSRKNKPEAREKPEPQTKAEPKDSVKDEAGAAESESREEK